MKYDDLYPNPEPDENSSLAQMGFSRQYGTMFHVHGMQDNCFVCGAITSWVDITFEAPKCSTECEDKVIEELRKL